MEEKLKLVQLFFHCVTVDLENLYGNMTAIGRRWVVGSFRGLIDFNSTMNGFNFSFILKFSTDESSSPVGRR